MTTNDAEIRVAEAATGPLENCRVENHYAAWPAAHVYRDGRIELEFEDSKPGRSAQARPRDLLGDACNPQNQR